MKPWTELPSQSPDTGSRSFGFLWSMLAVCFGLSQSPDTGSRSFGNIGLMHAVMVYDVSIP